MRHRIGGRQFGLPSDQRRALLKGLVRSLIIHKRIQTTETRAKDVRSIAEKLVTKAQTDSVHARRIARWCDCGVRCVRVLAARAGP